jgi:copper(I)-binding protein
MPVPIKGVPIGAVFAMARMAIRREKLQEYRLATLEAARAQRAEIEEEARGASLDRMREISNAQMVSHITGSEIPAGIMVPRGAGVSRPFVSPFVPQLVASPTAIAAQK